MVIIVGIIVLVLIGFALAIPIAILVVRSQNQAKAQAKRMLESGQIFSPKELNRVSKILSTMSNDLEAKSLWEGLQKLKSKYA